MDRLSSIKDLYIFQKKRFLRIYPLHFIMLFVFLGIEFLKLAAEMKFGITANNKAFTENNLTSFIANLFLIQNWTLNTLTYNGPSWSISAEFITYAFFAVSVYLVRGKTKILSVALVMSVIVFGYILSIIGMESNKISGPLRCLFSFSIGVLTYQIYIKYKSSVNLNFSLPSITLLALSVFLVAQFGHRPHGLTVLIPIIFSAAILSVSMTAKNTHVNKCLSNGWLVYLGTLSYGIYMIHNAVWWVIRQFLRLIFNVKTTVNAAGDSEMLIGNVFVADCIAILGIIIVLILAHFSYNHIEKRFNSPKSH